MHSGRGNTVFASIGDDAGPASAARDLCVRIEPGFDFESREYLALYGASGATVFQHPIWLSLLHARLAPARNAASTAICGRGAASGRLRFVLPMITRRKSGVKMLEASDLGVSDYAAPVVDTAWLAEGAPDPQKLAGLVADVLPAHDVLRIRPVRDEHVATWRRFFPARAERLDFSAHAVNVDPPYADWRARTLSGSFARYLDRRKRRFFRLGGALLRRLDEPGEIRAGIAALARLRRGRFAGDPIAHDAVHDFYTEVAVAGAAADLARTYVLETDDGAAGYVFGLTGHGRFHYLLIGCDYEAWGRHSPGLILYDTIIADWIADGGRVFDFTIGDEAFKADFGTAPTPIHIVHRAPTWRGKLALAALRARRTQPAHTQNHGGAGKPERSKA